MTAWVSGGGVLGEHTNRQCSGLYQGTTSLKLKRPLSIKVVDEFEPTVLKSNSPLGPVAANKNMMRL